MAYHIGIIIPDVDEDASLFDIDDPKAEIDGISKARTCADPGATLEKEVCGIGTTLVAGSDKGADPKASQSNIGGPFLRRCQRTCLLLYCSFSPWENILWGKTASTTPSHHLTLPVPLDCKKHAY